MRPLLVTNNVIIFLLMISCSSLKQDIQQKENGIVNLEIFRLQSSHKNEKIYLDFNLNDYLVNFLNRHKKSSETVSELNNSYNNLTDKEIELFFNKNEVIYLIQEIKNNNFRIDKLKLPNNFVLNNTLKEKENIGNDGLKSANYFSKKRLFLSKPIFHSNGNYSLIAYSYGVINSTTGGVHVYKKINGEWEFYTELEGWIE